MKRFVGIVLVILLIYNFCSNHLIYAGKAPGIAYSIQTHNNSTKDVFGIRKLYDSKFGGFEWYMNMSNPQADPYLYNYHKMRKNPDGSYNIGNVSSYRSIQKMESDMLKAVWTHTISPNLV